MVDSATYRQEVSEASSALMSSQRDLTFTVAEENNTDDKEKKGQLGNKIERLRSNVVVNSSNLSAATSALRSAEASERKEKLTAENTEREELEKTKQREEEAKLKEEQKDDSSKINHDKKPFVAKKEPVMIGGELYNVTDAQDKDAIQAELLKKLEAIASQEHEAIDGDPHQAGHTCRDTAEVAGRSGATTNSAIATVGTPGSSSGIASEEGSQIKAASGSNGAST